MTKLEELRAALEAATPSNQHIYEFSADGTCSIYTDTGAESMADETLVAYGIRHEDDAILFCMMRNNLPALLKAAEFLEVLSPYLDERQQPGEMWAALGCRQILEKLK
jgi:hypothetical protein